MARPNHVPHTGTGLSGGATTPPAQRDHVPADYIPEEEQAVGTYTLQRVLQRPSAGHRSLRQCRCGQQCSHSQLGESCRSRLKCRVEAREVSPSRVEAQEVSPSGVPSTWPGIRPNSAGEGMRSESEATHTFSFTSSACFPNLLRLFSNKNFR